MFPAALQSESQNCCKHCVTVVYVWDNGSSCPFRRLPVHKTDEEGIERIKKRMEANDAQALNMMEKIYSYGLHGFEKDLKKAQELWLKTAELGMSAAHANLADAYGNEELGEDEIKRARCHM